MYCRECHYDLRGQTEPRCPECGCRFDPRDGSTYLRQVPTALQTVFRNDAVRIFAKLLTLAVLHGVLFVLFYPGLFSSRCGPVSGRAISRSLLRSIVEAQLLNADSSSEDGTLTIEAVRHDLAPSWYSRGVEPRYKRANRWNRRGVDILTWCLLAIGPTIGTALFTRRWLRKLAIVMASLCILLAVFLLTSAYVVGAFMRTSSYAYLNDYVLVPSFDWRRWESSPWNRIVAFEKNPWPGSSRVVATGPMTTRILKEGAFQKLLLEQPPARGAWNECVAAGECTTIRK